MSSQKEILELLNNRSYDVLDLFPVSDEKCMAQYKFKDSVSPVVPNSSILIGILVTAYARMKLYSAMENASHEYGINSLICKFNPYVLLIMENNNKI